jgi:hypothetical protein
MGHLCIKFNNFGASGVDTMTIQWRQVAPRVRFTFNRYGDSNYSNVSLFLYLFSCTCCCGLPQRSPESICQLLYWDKIHAVGVLFI